MGEQALLIMAKMLIEQYEHFYPQCGGDYDRIGCTNCHSYLECKHGDKMRTMALQLKSEVYQGS